MTPLEERPEMSEKAKDGDPTEEAAFPFHFRAGDFSAIQEGLSKRELFAGMAMQGILQSMTKDESCYYEALMESAVKCADALIAALTPKQGG